MVEVEVVVGPQSDPPASRIPDDEPRWPKDADAASLRLLYERILGERDAGGDAHVVFEPLDVTTGGWPVFAAAREAMRAVRAMIPRLRNVRRITFVCDDAYTAAVFRDALAAQAMLRRPSAHDDGEAKREHAASSQ